VTGISIDGVIRADRLSRRVAIERDTIIGPPTGGGYCLGVAPDATEAGRA
jgi:hypothetical protein